ncbi:MAG TPA: PAS domain S-box protein [Pyrinomonadaceae bacterium]|nr:PAS domain S-box protein [Pyrinomonadaceae bacterium]
MTADSDDKGAPAQSAPPPRRALALRWHLVLLVVGALLPLVVFAAVVVYRLAESERAATDRRLLRSAQDVSLSLDRELQSTIRTLRAVAEAEELDRADLAAFHVEAKRVVSTQPAWLTLILLKPDGQQLVNTNAPWGTPLPEATEPESLRLVVEQKRPVVGSLTRGRRNQALGFPVRVPVLRGGETRYVLTAVITPDALAGVVGLRGQPSEELARAVVDAQGIIVARSREQEKFVGTPVKESFTQRMRGADEGLFYDVARDGTPVYVAFSREPSTGWTAVVAVPAAVAESPARSKTTAVLGLGLGLLALSTLGAFVISRHVRRGLLAAAEAAETMSRGERPAPLTSNVKEVAQLGRALTDSAALLAQHEQERNEQLAHATAARAEAEAARRAQEGLLRNLRESEARLQLVADHAPVLITYCGADRIYRFVNEPYAERFGLRPSQVTGRSIEEFLGPEAYAAIEPYVDAVLRGERLEYEVEIPYERLGARHMWVAYAPEFDEEGRVTGFVSAILDVTERKRAEQRLRESEERFAKAFESSPLALTITSLKTGRLLEVNETFTRLSGHTREEAVGRTTLELGLWAEPSDRAAELAVVARHGRIRDVEYRFRMKDGRELTGMLSAEQIEIAGEPCALTVIEDVTERRRAEAERDRMLVREKTLRAEAEKANRLKDEFLATVSHELRTPLTAILGWAHMLETDGLEEKTARHAVAVIKRNALQQKQIVEDILDVSRVITGKLRLESGLVELTPVVQAALDTIAPAAEAKGLRLRSSLDPLAAVTGDAARLQQVVWNLLANAVKFTPAGGEVRASVQRLLTHVRIEVSDTGQGILPEFLPYAFDRFRQADMGTTRQHGGLGLGLSIVRHLVEAHGGSVHAYSAGEGLGSTFTVDLPLPAEAELPVPRAEAPAAQAQGTARPGDSQTPPAAREGAAESLPPLVCVRVLVVDDDEDTLEMLTLFLRRAGAEVARAESAAAALETLERFRPDVLVADIGMPEVDGYELLRRVRALAPERGGLTPAVALTAYAGESDRARALRSGFQAHLPKPVEPAALIDAVTSLAGTAAPSEF